MFDAEEVVWSDLGEIDNMYFGFETSHPESWPLFKTTSGFPGCNLVFVLFVFDAERLSMF